MKCLMLTWRLESGQVSHKNFCFIQLLLNLSFFFCFVYLQPFCVTLDFKLSIDSIHILFLLYLLLWFRDFNIKNLQDFIKIYRALIKVIFLDLYCSKGKSCRYKFYWPSFGMAYGNPRFSEQGKVLTKVALKRSRMVLCSADLGAHEGNEYWRTLLDKLTLTSIQLAADAIYVPLNRKTPIRKPAWGSMLSVVDESLAPVPREDLDSAMVQEIQPESSGFTLDVLKNHLQPRDAVETTPGADEYVVSHTVTPNSPCRVSNPDVVSECGLSEVPSCIHPDDETEHDAFFAQTCVEEVENAEYAAPLKPLLSMSGEEFLDEELDARSRLREYVDSKRRVVAEKLCYARPTRRSWPLEQGSMGVISQLKEDLEQKITTWQREVDLKLMKSVWGAHVRTLEEDELSEECVCEPPRVCLCCHQPPETVERGLLYNYQGLKDTTKDAELVEDHLPASIHQGQAMYTLTRTWRKRSNSWTLEYRT